MKTPILKACPCCDAPLFADGPAQTVTPFCEQIRSDGVLLRGELWWRCGRCGCEWGHGSVAIASAPAGEHGHEWQGMERAAAKAYGEPIGIPDPDASEMDDDGFVTCRQCLCWPSRKIVGNPPYSASCQSGHFSLSGYKTTTELIEDWNKENGA